MLQRCRFEISKDVEKASPEQMIYIIPALKQILSPKKADDIIVKTIPVIVHNALQPVQHDKGWFRKK